MFLKRRVFKFLKRVKRSFFLISAFIIGYLIYEWGEKEHTRLGRKNPADYANDE
jgi:hypothetical protein